MSASLPPVQSAPSRMDAAPQQAVATPATHVVPKLNLATLLPRSIANPTVLRQHGPSNAAQGTVAKTISQAKKDIEKPKPTPNPLPQGSVYDYYDKMIRQTENPSFKAFYSGIKGMLLVTDGNFVAAHASYVKAVEFARHDPESGLHKGLDFYQKQVNELHGKIPSNEKGYQKKLGSFYL